jgi:hypothetical protein
MGIEPTTPSLPRTYSTPELRRLRNVISTISSETYNDNRLMTKSRAGDEARTRDLQLGRLSLYQLSYFRKFSLEGKCKEILLPRDGAS